MKAAAERRVAERKAREAAARLGVVAPGYADPFDVLDETLAEVVALKERLRALVATLGDESVRYEGRAGEQIRGEIQAYMASIRDAVKTAETIVKLGLDERRVRIREAEIVLMATGIRAILGDLELDPRQRAIARESVPRRLRELESGSAAAAEPARTGAYTGKRRPAELALPLGWLLTNFDHGKHG